MSETPDRSAVGRHTNNRSPRILATVLVSDVVDSTARAAALGDERWTRLLEHHDALVRTAVECFEGQVVKATGDGVLAVFGRPSLAVGAAGAMRILLHPLGLRIRVGIHTGEIQLRHDDVAGIAVHVAERVARLAAPGDVLVSGAVKDLVLGSGIEFDGGRRHALRGIPGSWRLFAVRQTAVTAEPPPPAEQKALPSGEPLLIDRGSHARG